MARKTAKKVYYIFRVTEIIKFTPKAVLIDLGGQVVWLPKSCLEMYQNVTTPKYKRDILFVFPSWLAEKKDMVDITNTWEIDKAGGDWKPFEHLTELAGYSIHGY